jgi:alcohol dehydrogenase class IV
VPVTPLPLIAVPTTAGTGSEVTPFAVITYRQAQRKQPLNHPALFARYALLDPELLVSAPRPARVAAGMDALTHAIESFTSKQATDRSRARAAAAMAEIFLHLEAVAAPTPQPAALGCLQWAAMVAGLAFSQSRLGLVHALSLPLSARFGVPHGLANAILLPYAMRYNAAVATELYGQVAQTLGLAGEDPTVLAAQAADCVRALAGRLEVPPSLAAVGVTREALPAMADDALHSPHVKLNPRPLERSDLLAVYEQAWQGEW